MESAYNEGYEAIINWLQEGRGPQPFPPDKLSSADKVKWWDGAHKAFDEFDPTDHKVNQAVGLGIIAILLLFIAFGLYLALMAVFWPLKVVGIIIFAVSLYYLF